MGSNNPWITHLAKIRKANPKVKDIVKLSKIAKASYKPAIKKK